MAPRIPRAGSSHTVANGLQQKGEPPQSSLATQLVSRFANGTKASKDHDQETFQQLLREVLGAEIEQNSQSQFHDTGIEITYKLIYVIVKAGLDTLANDNPFNRETGLSKQLIDSLAAVESTLKRSPEVLFVSAPGQLPRADSQGVLFLWLIPRIVAVAARTQEQGIVDHVLKLLGIILASERKTESSGIILKYIEGCIKGQPHRRAMSITADSLKIFLLTLSLPPPAQLLIKVALE